MSARIIDGKSFAATLRARIAQDVTALERAHGVAPGLAVVLVGDDPASQVYVGAKHKASVEAGMASFEHKLPANTPEADLLALIRRLNGDPKVHGILVQLPLPSHLDAQRVIQSIDPDKDVDGLHVVNAGRLASGLDAMVPCTPLGCLLLLKDVVGPLQGLDALVIGRSNLFGKPMAQLLLAENATVTIAHSRTRDLAAHCRRADILIAAVGRPQLVRGDWVKPGATVIDVGINRIPAPEKGAGKTRLTGDVAFEEVLHSAAAITPVPGGVGPMTIACLLRNTLDAARKQLGIAPLLSASA